VIKMENIMKMMQNKKGSDTYKITIEITEEQLKEILK